MKTKWKLIIALASSPLFVYLWPMYLGGDTEFIAVNGISMTPTFDSGSLAIVKKSPTYEVGDIAVYYSDALKRTVVHRIVSQQGDGFIFQGDHNVQVDPGIIKQNSIHGNVIFIVPYLGFVPQLLKTPIVMVFSVLALVATMFRKNKKKEKKVKKKASQSFFPAAILVNIASYVLVQISISIGVTPKMDGLTNYLFKMFEPYIASTIAFACWFFLIIGIHYAMNYYQAHSSKQLQHIGKNNTLQIKEQNSLQIACEAFYILLAMIQIIILIGVVRGLFPSG